ncbi:MAG: hypothetical protein WA655_01890 [Candidatus Korobacteraceae bacterium]
MADGSACGEAIYFNSLQSWGWPPPQSYTHNLWVLNNALCRQLTGDWGAQGTAGLTYYMGDPAPLAPRFVGNVLFVPQGDQVQSFPTCNLATQAALTFDSNWRLLSPVYTSCTDGKQPGYNQQ